MKFNNSKFLILYSKFQDEIDQILKQMWWCPFWSWNNLVLCYSTVQFECKIIRYFKIIIFWKNYLIHVNSSICIKCSFKYHDKKDKNLISQDKKE